MFIFGEKHPVLFEIILIIVAFLAAGIITAAGGIFYIHSELSSCIGRIFIGVVLLIIYRRAFKGGRPFSGLAVLIPALLFPLWNLFYNLSSGMVLGGPAFFIEAIITAMAPAIFEEVIFRGIFIYNLQKKGSSDIMCLIITAIVFAAVHLTNIVGQDILSVALQLVYSFVIGLVLAAVYLRNHSLLQVIVLHFLVDFTNSIYLEQATSASVPQLVIFALLLVVEAVFAVVVTRKGRASEG